MKIRGHVALVIIFLGLLVADVVQRLIIVPMLWLRPHRRIAIMTRWQRLLAWWVLASASRIGGAHIPPLPCIPGAPGTLILMNHQSVLDIPLMVASVRDAYPRIVTRKRYLRWIPLISHMVRLYQYPVVNLRANARESRAMLKNIREAARTSPVPLGIFPEGTRTRDGEIGPFKTTGLRIILRQRPWQVYLLVADGFWQRAKLKHFLAGMADIRGSIRLEGPFPWDPGEGDPEEFIAEMRERMIRSLHRLRPTESV
ncbi:MAG: lysophospholipid acyltransferase family protein [Gemmatimonadota bacterium]